jgi:RNA polymerase sigma factor for flagellar operon FliA
MKVTSICANIPDREARRNNAILQYLDLVRMVAKRLVRRLPPCVDFDDLVSAGVVGLIQALDRFDREVNVKFRTYAKYRIRGAMLDFLREEDPLSRSERAKLRPAAGELSAGIQGASFVVLSLTAIPEFVLDRLAPSTNPVVLIRSEVQQARRCLSGEENRVIELLYDCDLARNDVAAMLRVGPSRISQIRQCALQKMRVLLESESAARAA